MKAIDMLNLLVYYAKQYRTDSVESLQRNNHMNEIDDGEVLQQRHIDAVLVDFINYVGVKYCIDYALNTKDLWSDYYRAAMQEPKSH